MVFVGFRGNLPFEINVDFWSDFGTNLAPFFLRKSTKIEKKTIFNAIIFSINFYIVFCSIFDRFWTPSWNHVGFKNPSKIVPDDAQDALISENVPGSSKWLIWDGFWTSKSLQIPVIFSNVFFIDFWRARAPFWEGVLIDFRLSFATFCAMAETRKIARRLHESTKISVLWDWKSLQNQNKNHM